MTPPILYLIFNRPDLMVQSFAKIREARPGKLFVAADGPRSGRVGEVENCAEARRIVEQVDWPCDVKTLFRSQNLGCRKAVSAAITWFFEHVEEGIILEDDCVADLSVFPFCAELLERYRDDKRIMVISGDNFQPEEFDCNASYYFSKYPHCWGWATWRRAWILYDDMMKDWPSFRGSLQFYRILKSLRQIRYWHSVFDGCYKREIDSWAYVWTYACWLHSGRTVLPNVNLVQNIGDGNEATHTKGFSRELRPEANTCEFPLVHPAKILINRSADRHTDKERYSGREGSLFIKCKKLKWRATLRGRNWWQSLRNVQMGGLRRFTRLLIQQKCKINDKGEPFGGEAWLFGYRLKIFYPHNVIWNHQIQEIFCHDCYRLYLIQVDNPVIYDVGANIGSFALYAKWKFPKARVVCVEPDAKNVSYLQRNIDNNKLENVELIPKAVTGDGCRVSMIGEQSDAMRINSQEANGVTSVTLDELVREHCHLIKIDIEGAECAVLHSSKKALRLTDRICVEFHKYRYEPSCLQSVINSLFDNGGFDEIGIHDYRHFDPSNPLEFCCLIHAWRNV